MEYLVHTVGLANSLYTAHIRSSRKFFCVCDKINIYEKTPQCMFGAACHLISLLFLFLSLDGYIFYPVSLWSFILFFTSIYFYKSHKELCRHCITAFITSSISLYQSYYHLNSFPYIVSFFYFSILLLNLCLTSAALSRKKFHN